VQALLISYGATVLIAFPPFWFLFLRFTRDSIKAGESKDIPPAMWEEAAMRRLMYALTGVLAFIAASAWLNMLMLVLLLKLALFALHRLDDHDQLESKMGPSR